MYTNRLKITQEHYAILAAACNETITKHPDAWRQYRVRGLSATRYRFDVMHASRINGDRSCKWVCDALYPYLNDEHIGSALNAIIPYPELGS